MLVMTIVTYWKTLEYNFYKYITPNDAVKIIEIDTAQFSKYEQILQLPEFKGKPSFIYFNTRFSYSRLKKDTTELYKLFKHSEAGELNLIYIANGLEDEPDNKKEWEIYVNKLNLKGYHISLPDGYKDADTFFRTTEWNEGKRSTYVPHYLLADKFGNITDTIFKGDIDVNRVVELIK